jgi:hypothetical protein
MKKQSDIKEPNLKPHLIGGPSEFPESCPVTLMSKVILNLALGPEVINEIAKSWGMSWNMGRIALESRMTRMLEADMSSTGSLRHLNCLVHGMEHECKRICDYQACMCQQIS